MFDALPDHFFCGAALLVLPAHLTDYSAVILQKISAFRVFVRTNFGHPCIAGSVSERKNVVVLFGKVPGCQIKKVIFNA